VCRATTAIEAREWAGERTSGASTNHSFPSYNKDLGTSTSKAIGHDRPAPAQHPSVRLRRNHARRRDQASRSGIRAIRGNRRGRAKGKRMMLYPIMLPVNTSSRTSTRPAGAAAAAPTWYCGLPALVLPRASKGHLRLQQSVLRRTDLATMLFPGARLGRRTPPTTRPSRVEPSREQLVDDVPPNVWPFKAEGGAPSVAASPRWNRVVGPARRLMQSSSRKHILATMGPCGSSPTRNTEFYSSTAPTMLSLRRAETPTRPLNLLGRSLPAWSSTKSVAPTPRRPRRSTGWPGSTSMARRIHGGPMRIATNRSQSGKKCAPPPSHHLELQPSRHPPTPTKPFFQGRKPT